MRTLIFILFFSLSQLAFAQVKAKFHTVDRHAQLYDSPYKHAITGSFSYGQSIFMADLDQKNSRLAANQAFNFTVNKKIADRFSISTQFTAGELNGSGVYFDGNTSAFSDFTNNYYSFSILSREHFIRKTKEFDPNKKFQIHSSIGIGILVSNILIETPFSDVISVHKTTERIFIPGTLEFSYFITEHLGLMCAGDINYFYSDELDLHIANSNEDYFLSARFGMCFKFE